MTSYQRYQSLVNAAQLLQEEVKNWDEVTEEVLSSVVLDTIKRYQQKVCVGIEDSMSDLLSNFKINVTRAIFEAANSWRSASKHEITLYPKGCRFCCSIGSSTIIVIEQDPQVRSLRLGSDLCVTINSPYTALALPYSVFFFHFREGRFSSLYYGWRTRQLASLDDTISMPLLPNLHSNLSVCLGDQRIDNGTLIEQTQKVLDSFWGSQFNSDLSRRWHDKADISPLLNTAESWRQNSLDDPTFVLHLNYGDHRTVQQTLDMIAGSVEETVDESELRKRLSEQIDQQIGSLFNKMQQYFKRNKFEKHFPKKVKDELGKAIGNTAKEMADVIYALDVEVKKATIDSSQQTDIQPVSNVWSEYSS